MVTLQNVGADLNRTELAATLNYAVERSAQSSSLLGVSLPVVRSSSALCAAGCCLQPQ